MYRGTACRNMPFTREQIFGIVSDVERYHEFLPVWLAARVVDRQGDNLTVNQALRLGTFRLEFVSQANLRHPDRVCIIACDGSFRHLAITWELESTSPGNCLLRLTVEFEHSSPLVHRALGALFSMSSNQVLRHFEDRARQFHGNVAGPGESGD